MTRLCVGRPCDWWITGDDGNRLALMICSVCPAKPECEGEDPEPVGVIRAGVAWGEFGERRPLCPCGYPVPRRASVECLRCDPPQNVASAARHPKLHQVARLLDEGLSYKAIGARVGLSSTMVWKIVTRYRLRPQAVSTEEDAA